MSRAALNAAFTHRTLRSDLTRGRDSAQSRRRRLNCADAVERRRWNRTKRMPITLKNVERRVRKAVRHYWRTLDEQAGRQDAAGKVDAGNRTTVTGGKQMDGFCELLMGVLEDNGITKAVIHRHSRLEIPGYFRPTKKWDLLIFHGPVLVAVIEFKSQRGPSFGNNLNNRA